MNRFWSGVLAVVIGAIVGTLVSKEVAASLGFGFWAVLSGALVGAGFGGASAWAGADVPHFMQGVSRAWNEVISYRPSPMRGVRNTMYVMQWFIVSWGMISMIFGLFMIIGEGYGGFYLVSFMHGWDRYALYTVVTLFIMVSAAVVSFLLGFFFKEYNNEFSEKERDEWKDVVVIWNPVTTPLVVMLGASAILLVLGWVFSFVWQIVSLNWWVTLGSIVALILWAMREVFVAAYVYVHTYQRRCAFVGAVVGVLVASFTGHSVLVGAIVGVLTFSAEYQLATKLSPKLTPR